MRNICVVTTSRADYGLLRWLILDIGETEELHRQLVVTGSHLLSAYGNTCEEIEADGIPIDARVEIGPDDDSRLAAARSAGRAVASLAEAFETLSPDIVVLLGDRYETLAAAMAAMLLGIPIAHIHGGEITKGAFDDQARHALTKLSHLHFTAAEPYAARLRQMGEAPERVFMVGAPGVEAIRRLTLLTRAEIEENLGTNLGKPLFLVTYHPETLGGMNPVAAVDDLLNALAQWRDAEILFTGVNADPGNAAIRDAVTRFIRERGRGARAFDSLGNHRYLSLMAIADAVIGNSSSGIIEAPSLGVPTVNIGDRQAGRLRAASVIDSGESAEEIVAAIERALDPAFRVLAQRAESPYAGEDTARRICDVLRIVPLDGLTQKTFTDLQLRDVA
ncbi:MAG: UDP-N-acetylglucosamine 2-epimerase [Rhodospirillales bacterium]